jgi:hypothetical protein
MDRRDDLCEPDELAEFDDDDDEDGMSASLETG